jgi:hypothetical protein
MSASAVHARAAGTRTDTGHGLRHLSVEIARGDDRAEGAAVASSRAPGSVDGGGGLAATFDGAPVIRKEEGEGDAARPGSRPVSRSSTDARPPGGSLAVSVPAASGGGPCRVRTDDIHGVNVALYQLS